MARIACLGGVYNNYLALEAACLDARRRGVTDIYCLGDMGAFGPHPDRVFPILERFGVQSLQGNYDNSVARGLDNCQCGYTDPLDNHFAKLSYDYTLRNTSENHRTLLNSLPSSLQLELEGRRILLCHGSPRQVNEFLWESTTPTHLLEKFCDDYCADIILASHTGLHWRRELQDRRLFVNVGVVGRPANDGTTNVWYTILTVASDGANAEFVPVKYDHQRLAREMREEHLPEEFVDTVLHGWWTTCLEILPFKERARGKF